MVFLYLNMLANNAIKLRFFHNLISAPQTPSIKKDVAESAAPDDPSVKTKKEHVYQLLSHLTSQCVQNQGSPSSLDFDSSSQISPNLEPRQ